MKVDAVRELPLSLFCCSVYVNTFHSCLYIFCCVIFILLSCLFAGTGQESGQQWDGHNAWPPLQWLLIQGLRRSADALAPAAPSDEDGGAPERATAGNGAAAAAASARMLASELEEAFLAGALAGWEASGGMMEKYDANDTGKGGGGGEYGLQVGH